MNKKDNLFLKQEIQNQSDNLCFENLNQEELEYLLNNWDTVDYLASFSRLDISDSKLKLILEKLNWITNIYYFECGEDGYEDPIELESKDDRCPICNRKVADHEYRYSIEKKDGYTKEVKLVNKWLLNRIVDQESIPVLKSLKREKFIPFLGAGVSMPLGIPSWADLVYSFRNELDQTTGDYFEKKYHDNNIFAMIRVLLEDSSDISSESELKEKVTDLIISKSSNLLKKTKQNITDIINLNKRLVFTCNYDKAVEIFSGGKYSLVSLGGGNVLKKIQKNDYNIVHVHGTVDDSSKIVFTENDYNRFYSDENNTRQIQSLIGDSSILFIGFSLNDKKVIDQLEKIKNANGGLFPGYLISLPKSSYRKNDFEGVPIKIIQINNENIVDGIRLILEFVNDDMYI